MDEFITNKLIDETDEDYLNRLQNAEMNKMKKTLSLINKAIFDNKYKQNQLRKAIEIEKKMLMDTKNKDIKSQHFQ